MWRRPRRRSGLVAAAGDPALQRAEQVLAQCGFELDVRIYAPDVRGAAAGDQLANGLREAGLAGHDLVLLLREDGRPLSLAPYDSEAVVRAVATSTTPVLTGLGSPDEPAAAEEVSHQAYATADEATTSVVRRLQRAADLVEYSVDTVIDAGDEALRRAARRLEQTRHLLAEQFRQAAVRAEKARAARIMRVRILAGVIAAGVVAVAVATMIWPVLAALVVPLAIAVAAPRLRTQRRAPVSVAQYSFSQGLAQLAAISQQLNDVSDPDDVLRLEAEADAIADHCRALLRRPRQLRDRTSSAAPAQPPQARVAADGSLVDAGSPAEDGPTDVLPGAKQPPLDAALVEESGGAYDLTTPSEDDGRQADTQTLVLPPDPVRSER